MTLKERSKISKEQDYEAFKDIYEECKKMDVIGSL